MENKKGIVEYLIGWEQIPFEHRLVSILVVPLIVVTMIISSPLLVILEGLECLITGEKPTIIKNICDNIVGNC